MDRRFGAGRHLHASRYKASADIIRSGGCDHESGHGFDCSLIILFLFMTADLVISATGAMPGCCCCFVCVINGFCDELFSFRLYT